MQVRGYSIDKDFPILLFPQAVACNIAKVINMLIEQ